MVQHEAAHFLLGYLLGVPIASYSLSLGKEHTGAGCSCRSWRCCDVGCLLALTGFA